MDDIEPAPDFRADPVERFATFVQILGRGPGRSRSLSRDEARSAMELVLGDQVDPAQLGAFLMLLRYRGEDPDEIAGLVEAVRAAIGAGRSPGGEPTVMLDWPSYGAGRTRAAPWFLQAALALSRSGRSVLMHGTNEFSGGMTVADGLRALEMPSTTGRREAIGTAARAGFAYLPVAALCPAVAALLGMRRLFGLRSPINTVGRLLDPADAMASVDGVFHPPYIEVHLSVAERLDRRSLLVLKGGGGEAERNGAKETTVFLTRREHGRSELPLPVLGPAAPRGEPVDADRFRAVWEGAEAPEPVVATIIGTVAIGLLALDTDLDPGDADEMARTIWARRHG
ncbi:glycosyl transferase family protein [Rhizosaccharibacter radicis]|uniref:Glycosyl transferase family protein n=1 Tax=Rhizosaccharibacter radicis TaxID=2782605 RepID=A0ABT1VWT9_9PROT|nr:glycosyl transferase family protein [Acetobacteraceae bacterium KSS12]